jgi:putative spermidine/putrescine transport system ATP-binding protein
MALGDRIVVMERGKISQIGSPQDIYYCPANAFVAEFIGAMNRVEGIASGGRLRLPAGSLPLPDDAAEGQPATAMFRPEDVQVLEPEDAAGDTLRGAIVNTFFMGDRTRFEIDIGAQRALVAETSRRGVWQPGQRVALSVPASALVKVPAAPGKEAA